MMLRLSPHVMPQIRQGLHDLTPQNLSDGTRRIHYAHTLMNMVKSLVAHGATMEAKRFRDESLFGTRIMDWNEGDDGKITIEPLPELENALGFSHEQIGVLFRDGRIRDDSAMTYLPTGEGTAAFADLLMRLHRGIDRTELLARAETHDIGFDEELLDDLIARGVIEPGEVASPPRDVTTGIAWFGHAYVRAATPSASVWFDPFPAPRLAWTDDERTSMFKGDVPDKFLLENYGPEARQVTQDEVPLPDAVFITHQDTDHMELGALALLPPTIPIYVPVSDPKLPWQLDMVGAIKTVIGDRDVRVLAHGESVRVGDIEVTAFPFVGEFPSSLPHTWNCYYVELPDQVWALCADSAVTGPHIAWFRERRANDTRPFGIMVNGVVAHNEMHGYRDTSVEPASFSRLYSWYLPPIRAFEPVPMCGLPVEVLRHLVKETGLTQVYLYAHGNLPWYRLEGTYLHHSHVGSHTLEAFERMEQMAISAGARVLRLQHAKPHVAAQVSAFPRR